MDTILQVLLFAQGPFFCYPWKLIANTVTGDSYDVAYKHFRVGHRNTVNVWLHFVCLFIQTVGNMTLLRLIDESGFVPQPFEGVRLFSLVTCVMWVLFLLKFSEAPKVCTAMSAASLALAYSVSPFVTRNGFDIATCSGLVGVLLLSSFLAPATQKPIPAATLVKFSIGIPLLFFGLFWQLEKWDALHIDPASSRVQQVQLAVVATLMVLSAMKNPLKPVVIVGAFLCRIAAVATGSDFLFYLGYAFIGSLMQGVSHAATREEATLVALERKEGSAKLWFEYAHVTYFPDLLFNALHDNWKGR